MNKYLKIFLYIFIFIIVIVGAVFLYKYLRKDIIIEEPLNEISTVCVKADDFEVINANGEKVKLSDSFGKPIIINFWAKWCEPCKQELPLFQEAYDKYSKDIEFFMVNIIDESNDTIDSVKDFMQNNNYNFSVYFDIMNDASDAYNVYAVPKTVFIDKDGNIIKTYIGMIDEQILERYINMLKVD